MTLYAGEMWNSGSHCISENESRETYFFFSAFPSAPFTPVDGNVIHYVKRGEIGGVATELSDYDRLFSRYPWKCNPSIYPLKSIIVRALRSKHANLPKRCGERVWKFINYAAFATCGNYEYRCNNVRSPTCIALVWKDHFLLWELILPLWVFTHRSQKRWERWRIEVTKMHAMLCKGEQLTGT